MSESIQHTDVQKDAPAEIKDNKAEAEFKNASPDLNALRDTLVAKFDTGISAISDDAGFKKALTDALNTIIANETSRLVNVADLKALTPEKRLIVNAQIKAWMATFTATLSGQVGLRRDASDVEATKKLLSNSFKSVEPGAQKPPEAKVVSLYDSFTKKAQSVVAEGTKLYDSLAAKPKEAEKPIKSVEPELQKSVDNTPEVIPVQNPFTFGEPQYHPEENGEKKPKSITMNYEKDGQEPIKMILEDNKTFYETKDKSGPGTLADKIKKNSDVYKLAVDVNYNIENKEIFQKWIQDELKTKGYDIRKMDSESAIKASAGILIDHLQPADIPSTDPEKPDDPVTLSNRLPIDQLLIKNSPACCRHYAAAHKVVFEQIQEMALTKKNHNLEDIVPFENVNLSMAHATIAFARGDHVTTQDTFWNDGGWKGQKETPDSTFDGRHGNVTSIFATLSAEPTNDKGVNIFDLKDITSMDIGSSEIGNEFNANLTSNIRKADVISMNESIQTIPNLRLATAALLFTSDKLLTVAKDPENETYARAIKIISTKLGDAIRAKLLKPETAEEEKKDLISCLKILRHVIGAPMDEKWESKETKPKNLYFSEIKKEITEIDKIYEIAKVEGVDSTILEKSKMSRLLSLGNDLIKTTIWEINKYNDASHVDDLIKTIESFFTKVSSPILKDSSINGTITRTIGVLESTNYPKELANSTLKKIADTMRKYV